MPDRRLSLSKKISKLYPFSDAALVQWATPAQVETPISRLSKSTAPPVADAMVLMELTDRKLEAILNFNFAAIRTQAIDSAQGLMLFSENRKGFCRFLLQLAKVQDCIAHKMWVAGGCDLILGSFTAAKLMIALTPTSTSCPVDRKPFQCVYKIDRVKGCTKPGITAEKGVVGGGATAVRNRRMLLPTSPSRCLTRGDISHFLTKEELRTLVAEIRETVQEEVAALRTNLPRLVPYGTNREGTMQKQMPLEAELCLQACSSNYLQDSPKSLLLEQQWERSYTVNADITSTDSGEIQVKTRPQIETIDNCCIDNHFSSLSCATGQTWCRMTINAEVPNQNLECNKFKKKRCILNKEEAEPKSEVKSLSSPNFCFTGDLNTCTPSDVSGLPVCVNSSVDIPDDSEIHLIQQKRDALKYHMSSNVAQRLQCNTSLSAEMEIQILPLVAFTLDEYSCQLSHVSTRIKDFSKRTCVQTSVQEGIEKKQAASGASGSRGTKKKTVTSSAQRRSTRNSKADVVNQVSSSPKSSNSDHDMPGCNSSSNAPSTEHPVKPPPKQRKRASKRKSPVRKRLRSAAQTQEESSESKEDSANESEQDLEKKCKVSGESSSEMTHSDIDASVSQTIEKDTVAPLTAFPICETESELEEQTVSISPPLQHFDNTFLSSSNSQDEQHIDIHDVESPSVLNNGQHLCMERLPSPTSERQLEMDGEKVPQSPITKQQLNIEGGDDSGSVKQQGSDEDHYPASPITEKKLDLEDSEFAQSPSCTINEGIDELSDPPPPTSKMLVESDGEDNSASLPPKDCHESKEQDCSSFVEENLQSDGEDAEEASMSLSERNSEITNLEKSLDSKNGFHSPCSPSLENTEISCKPDESTYSPKENVSKIENDVSEHIQVDEQQSVTEQVTVEAEFFSVSDLQTSEQSLQSCQLLEQKPNANQEISDMSGTVKETEIKELCSKNSSTTNLGEECEHDFNTEINITRTAPLEHTEILFTKTHASNDDCDSGNNQDETLKESMDITENTSLVKGDLQSSPNTVFLEELKVPLPVNSETRNMSDINNEQEKAFCKDNDEPLVTECDSPSSDHQQSEIDHPTEIKEIESIKPESAPQDSIKKEEVKSTNNEPKQDINDKLKKETRTRRSRFHSPSTTWSPNKSDVKERPRSNSRSKVRDSPAKRQSRSRSRDRDGERDHGGQWKGRNRDRRHRRQSRSKSKSRSRSRSASRNRVRNRFSGSDRNEDRRSPPWKDRRSYDNRKDSRGNERYKRREQGRQNEYFRRSEQERQNDHFRRNEPHRQNENFWRNESEKLHEPFRRYESEKPHEPFRRYESERLHEPFRRYESEKVHEPFRRNESEKLNEPFRRNEAEKANEPFQRNESEKPNEPFRRTEAEKPNEPFQRTEAEKPNEPFQRAESESLNEPFRRTEAESLNEPFQRTEAERLNEPFRRTEAESLNEPFQRTEAESLNEPFRKTEAERLNEPFQRTEAENLNEPFQRTEAENLNEPFRRTEAENLNEPFRRTEAENLNEPFRRTEAENLIEPFQRTEAESLSEPFRRTEAESLSEPFRRTEAEKLNEAERLNEPFRQNKAETLSEPLQQSESEMLSEPFQWSEPEKLNEPFRLSEPEKSSETFQWNDTKTLIEHTRQSESDMSVEPFQHTEPEKPNDPFRSNEPEKPNETLRHSEPDQTNELFRHHDPERLNEPFGCHDPEKPNETFRRHEPQKPNDLFRQHDSFWRHMADKKANEHFRNERHDMNRNTSEQYPDNDYPDWVMEKMKPDNRGRGGNRSRGFRRGAHWEDNHYNAGDSWNRNSGLDWNSPRGRGGRGRGGFRGGFGYGDQNANRWNNRPPFFGNSRGLRPESPRFKEQRNFRPKCEQDSFNVPADRSGWSSASSWAVRKTLPADVQSYYSKRGRNTTNSQSGWPRQEVPQDQDQTVKDQASQQSEGSQIPVNMIQTQMNVVQQQMNAPPPQPMNIFPYSVGVHPPMVNIQHNPYNIHPQLPMHVHPGLPLVQVSTPTNVPQALPPPPPPPPPSQQVSYISSQPDGKQMQVNPGSSHVSNNLNAPLLPAPAPTLGIVGTVVGPSSGSAVSSSHMKAPPTPVKPAVQKESVTVEASADSSKKEKKILIQEKAAQEVKIAIKPYYQNKDISKDEYKEIVKKAVDKVCHSKSGEVDSSKVANLIKAYVDKYKHSRKKETD
ncbi:protein SCAF11 [Rhinophrynus dorsalis]